MKMHFETIPSLVLVDQIDQKELQSRLVNPLVVSPLCPDYNFSKVIGPENKQERIHDFNGLGEDVGIVYKKLIDIAGRFFSVLDQKKINYQHILLVADVECHDETILKKLSINSIEFIRRCQQTVRKVNADLKKRQLIKSNCLLMSQFFKKQNYSFFKDIKILERKILRTKNSQVLALVKKAQKERRPLHKFWFNLSKIKSKQRTIEEIAMYTSFGHCPKIDNNIILCADSEILSHSYNLFKKKKTPVFYLTGAY